MKRLTDIRPQEQNANRHTERGMRALEQSIQADGWIGAITVAADGETFDGSARLEVGSATGFEDAIVVESDGTKPVVLVRTDIPSADDPRARRLGIAANRVAELNLEWEPGVLAQMAEEAAPFFTPEESGPTRTALGDLWQIGPHRLLVGDCTDPANVARLMGGGRAQTTLTDPPYNVGINYGGEVNDNRADYTEFSRRWFAACPSECVVFTPGTVNLALWYEIQKPKWVCVWRKTNQCSSSPLNGFNTWEPLLVYGKHPKPVGHDSWDIPVAQADVDHPVPKTVEAWQTFLEAFSTGGALLFDPFLGSGTTLIAAHRTGRRCYGMEIEPRYADVILRRAEAEGLTAHKVENTP